MNDASQSTGADDYPRPAETRHIVAHLIQKERDRQNRRYPAFARTFAEMSLVLLQEVGELSDELGNLTWPGGVPLDEVVLTDAIEEAIQVAAVAARIAEHLIERRERQIAGSE